MAGYTHIPIIRDAFTRVELGGIDETAFVQKIPTFFQRFFGETTGGRTVLEADAEFFGVDIRRAGDQKTAIMIPRGQLGFTMGSLERKHAGRKYTRVEAPFPLAEEVGEITQAELSERIFLESTQNPLTRMERARYHAREILQEQFVRFGRLFEYLCSQSVLYGVMPSILGNTDAATVYDWRMLGTHIVDKTANKWTTAGTSVLNDLDAAFDLNKDDGYLDSDFAVLGKDVTPFANVNTEFLSLNDLRRYYSVQVNGPLDIPQSMQWLIEGGAVPFARVVTPKQRVFHLFTLQSWYDDPTGTRAYYLPETSVLIGASKGFTGHRAFGPVELGFETSAHRQQASELLGIDTSAPVGQIQVDVSRPFVPEAIRMRALLSQDTKKIDIISQVAPVFRPMNCNGFVHYYNCA